MKWTPFALISTLAACSALTPPSKTTATVVTAPHASLAAYHTFSFDLADAPKSGYQVTPRSLDVERRLRSVVQSALQDRGYMANDAHGDLVVRLAAGTGSGTIRNEGRGAERSLPSGLALGYIGINVYDGSTGSEVWQGSAFAEIDPVRIDDSLLAMGVAHMLQDFPAREAARVATAH